MRHLLLVALSTTALGGCFRTYHWPTCAEIERRPLDDEEETEVGTAADLRARITLDDRYPGVTWDDREVEVDVTTVTDPQAEWFETELVDEVSRSFGFGALYPAIYVVCGNGIAISTSVHVRTVDGEVEVFANGEATLVSSAIEGQNRVFLDGPYSAATFPDTDEDPAIWSDKYTFVNVDFDEAGAFSSGTAGWGGSRKTDEVNSAMSDYVVDFFAVAP